VRGAPSVCEVRAPSRPDADRDGQFGTGGTTRRARPTNSLLKQRGLVGEANLLGGGRPDEGPGDTSAHPEMVSDRLAQSTSAGGFPRPRLPAGEASHQSIDQCRARSVGWEVMEMEPRMPGEPPLQGRRNRGEPIVEEQVDIEHGRGFAVDDLKERPEFHLLASVPKVGEHWYPGRAIRHGSGPFIGREGDGTLGRIQEDTDHVRDVLEEPHSSVARGGRRDSMRTDSPGLPNSLDRRLAHADLTRQRSSRPRTGLGRLRGQGGSKDDSDLRFGDRRRTAGSWSVLEDSRRTVEYETTSPSGDGPRTGPEFKGDLLIPRSFRSAEYNAGPQANPVRCPRVLDESDELPSLPRMGANRGSPTHRYRMGRRGIKYWINGPATDLYAETPEYCRCRRNRCEELVG